MDAFRFLPPTILALSSSLLIISSVQAMPAPQEEVTTPAASADGQPQTRFLPGLGLPTTNPNQGLQNSLAGVGLGAAGGFAATNCIFNRNCDLAFRPSLGAAIDANGQVVPQLGITTQVGNGPVAPTFTGGLQLGGQSGLGGFVAGGINNGNPNSLGFGAQTGFGFNQNPNGQLVATSQLGGNIQAPQLAGVNFGRPNGAPFGAQPTFLNQPLFGQSAQPFGQSAQPFGQSFGQPAPFFGQSSPGFGGPARSPLVRSRVVPNN